MDSAFKQWDVIVSDAKDFVANGAIEHYDSSGNLIRTVDVGYVPSEVVDHPNSSIIYVIGLLRRLQGRLRHTMQQIVSGLIPLLR